MAMTVRDATAADLPGVLAIYNDVVASSTAIFADQPTTLEERTAWWRERLDRVNTVGERGRSLA